MSHASRRDSFDNTAAVGGVPVRPDNVYVRRDWPTVTRQHIPVGHRYLTCTQNPESYVFLYNKTTSVVHKLHVGDTLPIDPTHEFDWAPFTLADPSAIPSPFPGQGEIVSLSPGVGLSGDNFRTELLATQLPPKTGARIFGGMTVAGSAVLAEQSAGFTGVILDIATECCFDGEIVISNSFAAGATADVFFQNTWGLVNDNRIYNYGLAGVHRMKFGQADSEYTPSATIQESIMASLGERLRIIYVPTAYAGSGQYIFSMAWHFRRNV